MIPGMSDRWQRLVRHRRWRDAVVIGSCCALLGIAHVAEWFTIRHFENQGEAERDRKTSEYLDAAVREFGQMQRTARRIGVEVGQHPDVLRYLSGETTERLSLFEAAAHAVSVSSVGIEIYDAAGDLVAWAGSGGSGGRREVLIALDGQMISLVSHSAVSSQLFVAVPLRHAARILGVVVVRQTIEVASPLRNRFLGQGGITERVSEALGVRVRYWYGPESPPLQDSVWVKAPLFGIDSSRVGTVGVRHLAPTALVGRVSALFDRVIAALECLLLVALAFPIGRVLFLRPPVVIRMMMLTGLLWGVRYLLVFLDAPARAIGTEIFQPLIYASTFGAGLARSAGDLTLTVGTLCANVFLIFRLLKGYLVTPPPGRHPGVSRIIPAAILTVVLFFLLRGYGATVRSVLFDSALTIGDPAILLPSLPMALLLLNGIALAWCLGAVSLATSGFLARFLGKNGLVLVALLVAVVAVCMGYIQSEPLTTLLHRLVFGGAVLGVLWILSTGRGLPSGKPAVAHFFGVTALSAVILLPLLDQQTGERDRGKIETFAAEVLRPVDGWLKFIVEEALYQMVSPPSAEEDPGHGASGYALQAWARSAACREGYSSVFELLDADGNDVSRFAIGGQAGVAQQVAYSIPLDTVGVIRMKSIGDGVSAVRVYGGTVPVWDSGGRYAGHVRVTVAAGEQQLFRGDNPAVLRGTSRETLESFYRPVTIAEYRDGLILRSTNPEFPFTRVLPVSIREELKTLRPPMAWIDETIGGTGYETFYALRGSHGSDIIGLSLERRSLLLRLVAMAKVGAVYAVLLLGLLALVAARGYLRGQRYRPGFRDRLLAAMVLTALLPLVVLLIYSQNDVRERLLETMSLRLDDQTAAIGQDIAGIGEHADASSELELRADRVELIASNAGTDFNLYVDNMLRISSRPELYAAGLLDARISGEAYAHVVLGGKRFHVETENIGLFRYAVGYRPVLDAAGGIIGIVSVPTLFRQDELERKLIERNAVLFGIYAVVLLTIVIVLPVLAHRFARPVLELTALVRDVGRGNLNVSSRLPRAEGEIGELVRTFNDMTEELQRSRDDLVKVERELAWKEMARQVAHEIKNPLTPIRLSIQHLRRAYLDNAPAFGQLLDQVSRTVIEQIDTLSRIASEFSNFARMPRRRLEPVAVLDIVHEAVGLFMQDTAVSFAVSAPEALPVLEADREELRRAFINILRNGVQAMNGHGTMTVTLSRAEAGVQILFRDTGPGIPDEVKTKLFQPNFSTKTDGMGLGLAIVKKTVTDLGGEVWIESEVGAGTTVGLVLPAGGQDEGSR